MTFKFPGQAETTPAPKRAERHIYRVEGNDPNNARVECDYIQFTPTHVTFWDENEPWDRLVLAVPLSANARVSAVEEGE